MSDYIDPSLIDAHLTGYHPAFCSGNQTPGHKQAWWDHPYCYEFPSVSRPSWSWERPKTLLELIQWWSEQRKRIEKLVVFRANPYYNKQVRISDRYSVGKHFQLGVNLFIFFVGSMSPQEWQFACSELVACSPNPKVSQRSANLPDHDNSQRPEFYDIIEWTVGMQMPALETFWWWMIKWWDAELMVCQRSLIKSFGLVRHTFTGVVYLIFSFECGAWSRGEKVWTSV